MSLEPGDVVEHFTILSPLGQGGMGQVYLARDDDLERNVALKIVHPTDAAQSSVRESDGAARLLREARAAAALEHPNVVTIYEVGEVRTEGEERGRPFIAMELVKGRSLRTFVGDASVSIAQRTRWLADIARALAAAHRATLVHRDIKPENVMVREDGVIKVLDFGVAKRAVTPSMSSSTSTEAQVLPSLTAKGVAVGTPYYMAPEQMRREPLDGRADQFSWGVVAYELLSGTPPWGREVDALELVSKLLTEHPRPLDEVNPEVPPHVVKVVARAMSKSRGDRFATMDDLIVALEDPTGAFAATVPFVSVHPPAVASPPLASSDGAPRHASTTLPSRRRVSRRTALVIACAAIAVAGSATWFGVTKRAATKAAAIAAAEAAKPECTRATECVAKNGGKPAVCNRSGKCAAIESAECKALYEPEDLKRDDVVWVGAMFPLSGDGADWGVSNMNAVELGRRDFAQTFKSLRGADGRAPVHALALVACDDASGQDEIARHLIRDVEAPAVIGFGHPPATVNLVSSAFVPSDTMTVASITLDPRLPRVPHGEGQPRMVWRTTYDNAETADAMVQLVALLERRVRRSDARPAVRVALVRDKTPGAAAFAERLFARLQFNEKPALQNGTDYREISMTDLADAPRAAKEVADFTPNVVLFTVSEVLAPIEASWPPSAEKPIYISDATFDQEVLRFVGKSVDRRRRMFGLTSVSTTMTNARFVQHYNETFPDQVTRAWAPNSSYDAFYLVAYASYAVGRGPLSGRALSQAVGRLVPPGSPFDVGTTAILGAFEDLSRGKAIDLNGATGSMDFDLRAGEAPVDLAVLCTATGQGGEAIGAIESGAVFDAKLGRLVSDPRCN